MKPGKLSRWRGLQEAGLLLCHGGRRIEASVSRLPTTVAIPGGLYYPHRWGILDRWNGPCGQCSTQTVYIGHVTRPDHRAGKSKGKAPAIVRLRFAEGSAGGGPWGWVRESRCGQYGTHVGRRVGGAERVQQVPGLEHTKDGGNVAARIGSRQVRIQQQGKGVT